MLSYLLAALESEEDKRRFTELYEENHVRAEQTALRILRDPHDLSLIHISEPTRPY